MRLVRLLPVLLVLLSPFVRAEDSGIVLSHHGRLLQENDVPAEGEHQLTFRLHVNAAALPGEAPVWQQTYTVRVSNGIYVLDLGDANLGEPLTSAHFPDDAPRYLGVSIGNQGELVPRQRIGVVPLAAFARKAADADRLGGLAADAWLTRADAALTYQTMAGADARFETIEGAEGKYLTPQAAASTYETIEGAAGKYVTKGDAQAFETVQGAAGKYLTPTSGDTAYLRRDEIATGEVVEGLNAAKVDGLGAGDLLTKDAAAARDTQNLIANGSFEAWARVHPNINADPALPIGWSFEPGVRPATVTRVVAADAPEGRTHLRLTNDAIASNGSNGEVFLTQRSLNLDPQRTYTLSFQVRGSVASKDKLQVFVLALPTTGDGELPLHRQLNGDLFYVPLTTDWVRHDYRFTTSADLVLATQLYLRFDHNGNGGDIDLDSVLLVRGDVVPAYSDPTPPCPLDMTDAGGFCVESPSSLVRNVTWRDANLACRQKGRRLCTVDELSFAVRGGVVARRLQSEGDFWSWTQGTFDGSGSVGMNACHVELATGHSGGYELGEANCQVGWASATPSIGGLCCIGR